MSHVLLSLVPVFTNHTVIMSLTDQALLFYYMLYINDLHNYKQVGTRNAIQLSAERHIE